MSLSTAIKSISIVRCPQRFLRTRPISCSIVCSCFKISSAGRAASTHNTAFTKFGPEPAGNAGVSKNRLTALMVPTSFAMRETPSIRRSLKDELFNLWLLPIATMQLWQSIWFSFEYIMDITYTCYHMIFKSTCDIFDRCPPLLTEIRADYI